MVYQKDEVWMSKGVGGFENGQKKLSSFQDYKIHRFLPFFVDFF